jgi:hypothetical protein
MTPDQFETCIRVARDFAYESPPDAQGRLPAKVVGIFGGEPLMSPHFPAYVELACQFIPDAERRGLWTSFDWTRYQHTQWGKAAPLVHKLLGNPEQGYLNWNMHEPEQRCEHHPVLVAISDVVRDERRRMELINECWLNRDWSAAYALDHNNEPKFYFCEVASSFDRVMRLGIGLAVEKGVWDHDLWFSPDDQGILRPRGMYASQILAACTRCGQPLPQKRGRRDREWKDDVSPSNVRALAAVHSPMVARGDYVLFGEDSIARYDEVEAREGYEPMKYIKERPRPSASTRYLRRPAGALVRRGRRVVDKLARTVAPMAGDLRRWAEEAQRRIGRQ